MKKILVLASVLFLASCSLDPIGTPKSNNPKAEVVTLFEVDGCTVYRFSDMGSSRYFSKCACGESSTTSYDVRVGKTSSPEMIPSVTK